MKMYLSFEFKVKQRKIEKEKPNCQNPSLVFIHMWTISSSIKGAVCFHQSICLFRSNIHKDFGSCLYIIGCMQMVICSYKRS